MQPELIRIRELAKRCGVTVRALEVYQSRGLIQASVRESNGYRSFDATLEEPIRAFGALLSHGASLREVAEVFATAIPLQRAPTPEQTRDSMIRAREFDRRHIALIDREIERLTALRADLEGRLAYIDDQMRSGGPVKIGRPAERVRQVRPGRVDYRSTRAPADIG